MSRAAKVAKAYDYKTRCGVNDACSVARTYFAQKFLDLGTSCEDVSTLEKHVACVQFPAVLPNSIVYDSCPVTITEAEPTECRAVTITVVQ